MDFLICNQVVMMKNIVTIMEETEIIFIEANVVNTNFDVEQEGNRFACQIRGCVMEDEIAAMGL